MAKSFFFFFLNRNGSDGMFHKTGLVAQSGFTPEFVTLPWDSPLSHFYLMRTDHSDYAIPVSFY